MRGKEPLVTCDNCGRSIPRNKAVVFEKVIKFNTDSHSENNVKFLTKRKVYYCISCAKHLGIFERKKREAMRFKRP
ncbi:MAG: hypothetical protein QW774_01575 [Candidatus Micrarchaeaceae archaeon]